MIVPIQSSQMISSYIVLESVRAGLHYGGEVHRSRILGEF